MSEIARGAKTVDLRVREGRFQRWLALAAGLSSALSGLEVGYLHYRGSYSRRVMYTPVILSAALAGAGVAAFCSRRAAKTVLPAVSALTLADCAIGSYFHIRGIQRKPGGWRLPLTNITMGPPIFGPLLFATSAYLGILASFLRRDEGVLPAGFPRPARVKHWARALSAAHEHIGWEQDLREGRFQKHMAIATAVSASCSGFEAFYSHYKSNFRYKVQWTPVLVGPLLTAAAVGAVVSPRVANTLLPAFSAAAMMDGAVGFGYHLRGVARRPGGTMLKLYNVIHGPPVLAPLLFAAAGFFGILASLLRRER
ncbi:MAG: hypothetical protein JO166_16990 [Deltaproteobacteria bacterium]|nr:hypothetical protein [Deltaproteobacteria bacterium]